MLRKRPYTHHIDGMDLEEGKALVRELFQHVQQDKYKFTVHWEQPGELVIWDNTSVFASGDAWGL